MIWTEMPRGDGSASFLSVVMLGTTCGPRNVPTSQGVFVSRAEASGRDVGGAVRPLPSSERSGPLRLRGRSVHREHPVGPSRTLVDERYRRHEAADRFLWFPRFRRDHSVLTASDHPRTHDGTAGSATSVTTQVGGPRLASLAVRATANGAFGRRSLSGSRTRGCRPVMLSPRSRVDTAGRCSRPPRAPASRDVSR